MDARIHNDERSCLRASLPTFTPPPVQRAGLFDKVQQLRGSVIHVAGTKGKVRRADALHGWWWWCMHAWALTAIQVHDVGDDDERLHQHAWLELAHVCCSARLPPRP